MAVEIYGPTVAYGKPLCPGWIHFAGWYNTYAYEQGFQPVQVTIQVACIVNVATVRDERSLTQVVTVNNAFVTIWPEEVLLHAMGVIP